ncbi:hypothetical protein GCM10009633_09550 [Janibacter melonis]
MTILLRLGDRPGEGGGSGLAGEGSPGVSRGRANGSRHPDARKIRRVTGLLRLPRHLADATRMRALQRTIRHPGTNGWTSEWGTNAHGEIAGCPPPA